MKCKSSVSRLRAQTQRTPKKEPAGRSRLGVLCASARNFREMLLMPRQCCGGGLVYVFLQLPLGLAQQLFFGLAVLEEQLRIGLGAHLAKELGDFLLVDLA